MHFICLHHGNVHVGVGYSNYTKHTLSICMPEGRQMIQFGRETENKLNIKISTGNNCMDANKSSACGEKKGNINSFI